MAYRARSILQARTAMMNIGPSKRPRENLPSKGVKLGGRPHADWTHAIRAFPTSSVSLRWPRPLPHLFFRTCTCCIYNFSLLGSTTINNCPSLCGLAKHCTLSHSGFGFFFVMHHNDLMSPIHCTSFVMHLRDLRQASHILPRPTSCLRRV